MAAQIPYTPKRETVPLLYGTMGEEEFERWTEGFRLLLGRLPGDLTWTLIKDALLRGQRLQEEEQWRVQCEGVSGDSVKNIGVQCEGDLGDSVNVFIS